MRAARIEIDWNPGLPIFASEPFLKAVGDEYGWLGGFAEVGAELRCILPYTIVHQWGFRMVRFRVETIPIGRDEIDADSEKRFLNAAVEYFRSVGTDMIIPATTNAIFRAYPDGAVVAPYGTYIIDLTESEETLWGNLNASHRRKVRLATKQGVQVRSGIEHLETAYQLVRDTFRRSNLGFMSSAKFKRYILGLGENVTILVAEYQGAVQGCLVVPFSAHCAHYVYGGSIPEPQTGATNLLHWEAIRLFRGLGIRRYDFVGVRIDPAKESKQEGLMMYKQRFGGRLVQGFMWKYSFHPLKYSAYSLAIRFLRGGDIVDQERHKLTSVSLQFS